jgi:hypothetical protein
MPALASDQLPAPSSAPVAAPQPAAPVDVAVSGVFDVMADLGRPVYVEALASSHLTGALRDALARRGLSLVASRDQATVVYELDGTFQALRPATQRRAEIRLGDYAENPAPLATKSGRGPSVMLSLNPLAILIGTIASNVGNFTGVQDSVNAATAGDPDGKCLSKCDEWQYKQRNVVTLTRSGLDGTATCSAVATVEDAALRPAELIQNSLDALAGAIGQPAAFASVVTRFGVGRQRISEALREELPVR